MVSRREFKMKHFLLIITTAFFLVACAPSPQAMRTAFAQTQEVWTKVPTQTKYPTQTRYPTQTTMPPVVETKIFVWTHVPQNLNGSCKPITNMDYEDNSKIMVDLQAYVGSLPDVKSVSYVIPEKLYINTISSLYHVQYISNSDGKVYAKRYIVYVTEFGWKDSVFSIDGQCWIDPPK